MHEMQNTKENNSQEVRRSKEPIRGYLKKTGEVGNRKIGVRNRKTGPEQKDRGPDLTRLTESAFLPIGFGSNRGSGKALARELRVL